MSDKDSRNSSDSARANTPADIAAPPAADPVDAVPGTAGIEMESLAAGPQQEPEAAATGTVQDPTGEPPGPLIVTPHLRASVYDGFRDMLTEYGEKVAVLERSLMKGPRPTQLGVQLAKEAIRGARDAAANIMTTRLCDLLRAHERDEADED